METHKDIHTHIHARTHSHIHIYSQYPGYDIKLNLIVRLQSRRFGNVKYFIAITLRSPLTWSGSTC